MRYRALQNILSSKWIVRDNELDKIVKRNLSYEDAQILADRLNR